MTVIYVITVFLLIVCFLIIEKSLAKESKSNISYLEDQILIRDNKLIEVNEQNKNLKFRLKLLTNVNESLEKKLHRNRDEKGHFVKSTVENEI